MTATGSSSAAGSSSASSTATANSTDSTETTAPAAGTSTTGGSTSNGPLSLGQSAQFAGGEIIGQGAGEQVAVTVQRVTDPAVEGIISLGTAAPPPSPGQRRVAVELSIDNVGSAQWSETPGDLLALISKSTNGSVGQVLPGTNGPGQCATDLSHSANIAPGQSEKGCVYFQVPTNQKIGRVQLQTQGGGGGNSATWRLH